MPIMLWASLLKPALCLSQKIVPCFPFTVAFQPRNIEILLYVFNWNIIINLSHALINAYWSL